MATIQNHRNLVMKRLAKTQQGEIDKIVQEIDALLAKVDKLPLEVSVETMGSNPVVREKVADALKAAGYDVKRIVPEKAGGIGGGFIIE